MLLKGFLVLYQASAKRNQLHQDSLLDPLYPHPPQGVLLQEYLSPYQDKEMNLYQSIKMNSKQYVTPYGIYSLS
jgi:hypothetical protein